MEYPYEAEEFPVIFCRRRKESRAKMKMTIVRFSKSTPEGGGALDEKIPLAKASGICSLCSLEAFRSGKL